MDRQFGWLGRDRCVARGPGALPPEGTVFVAVARGKQEAYLSLEHVIVPTGRLGVVGRIGWERADNRTCSGVRCGVEACD